MNMQAPQTRSYAMLLGPNLLLSKFSFYRQKFRKFDFYGNALDDQILSLDAQLKKIDFELVEEELNEIKTSKEFGNEKNMSLKTLD